MNLLKHKMWYLIISGLILVPGIVALLIFKLNLSIDFVGGSLVKYQVPNGYDVSNIVSQYKNNNVEVEGFTTEGADFVIRTKSLDVNLNKTINDELQKDNADIKQVSFETVGPIVGKETTKNAFVSLGWASLAILLYIAYAFRNIPSPYSSFKFGASAIIAMLHDAVVVLGVFAILGHYKNVEIDAMFITAILTVIGFSVHDTIVVFDRIRENLSKLPKTWQFETIANYSLVETLNRSLATSLTVIFTLSALYILGGDSIRNFVLALLIGIVSGTYSSIFTATPILVIWESYKKRDK
jgi:preprotein translocase subunit SecF